MHSYAQLLSKLLPSPQNGGGVWGGGCAPSSGKIKNVMNCFTRT